MWNYKDYAKRRTEDFQYCEMRRKRPTTRIDRNIQQWARNDLIYYPLQQFFINDYFYYNSTHSIDPQEHSSNPRGWQRFLTNTCVRIPNNQPGFRIFLTTTICKNLPKKIIIGTSWNYKIKLFITRIFKLEGNNCSLFIVPSFCL